MSNVYDFLDTKWFYGSRTQTMRYRAFCEITIGSQNVTDRLEPYLISLRVRDTIPWEAWIELDDRYAELTVPPVSAFVGIELGWYNESPNFDPNAPPPARSARVFLGWVTEVESMFGRTQGGRRMMVHCTSDLWSSNIKTPYKQHLGEGPPPGALEGPHNPFVAMCNMVAGAAGTSCDISAAYAQLGRDYWAQDNESAVQWFERHADELGAVVRLEQNKFVLRGPMDKRGGQIIAQWGDNLIGWHIKPYATRSIWEGSKQQYFNHITGQWVMLHQSFSFPYPWNTAISTVERPEPAPNPTVAQQHNQGANYKQNWLASEGRVIINGEPDAQWWGDVTVIGARPGVDGTYKIWCAEHTYSRQGYITILETYAMGLSDGAGQQDPLRGGVPRTQGIQLSDGTLVTYPTSIPIPEIISSGNQLILNGVTVTNPNGTLIDGIWNNQTVNDTRLMALNTGNPDPLAGFPNVPPPTGL